MKSRTLTEDSFQTAVRLFSRDLKKFDHSDAGGGQQSQKTKFQLAFHSRLCWDPILSPTRQDLNLSTIEYHSATDHGVTVILKGDIIFNSSS